MFTCSECRAEVGVFPQPYRCPRTGRLNLPHDRVSRRTPPPLPDPFEQDRGKRAQPRRRRQAPAATIDDRFAPFPHADPV